jgi:uncharacterized BrkB/YihY/UPF0761 family membrane protein
MKKKLFLLLITLLLLVSFSDILAVSIPNPLGVSTFQDFIRKLAGFVQVLALAIAPIVIIYAGIRFVTAAGDPQKVKDAQKIIFWTLVGVIIISAAKAIIDFFQNITK